MIAMNAAIGEREGAWIVATGASEVSATVDDGALGPLKAAVYFGHFVSFDGRVVPDALLPWNGASPADREAEPAALPPGLRPPDAKPGGYRATVTVTTDGKRPRPGDDHGLRRHGCPRRHAATGTSSRLPRRPRVLRQQGRPAVPSRLERRPARRERRASSRSSPPTGSRRRAGASASRDGGGYTGSPKWWLDAAGNMVGQSQALLRDAADPDLEPAGERRQPDRRDLAVRARHLVQLPRVASAASGASTAGWTGASPTSTRSTSPGWTGMKLVAEQAAVAHRCFPGSRMLVTGNPSTVPTGSSGTATTGTTPTSGPCSPAATTGSRSSPARSSTCRQGRGGGRA